MNPQNYISDEEFLPFLQNLEVESDRKSFEWMFNDPELSGVLQWLYNSLDHSNALSAREKYRYAEIEQHLLSPEDLAADIASLQEEFQGLCLPGDQESMQDAKADVQRQHERLQMLEKQEVVIRDLIKQNDLAKDELSREITKLNSAQHQLAQDETTAAEECLALAGDVETLTEGVIDVIADSLSLYSDAHADKEIAKKFVSFGPFESYRQAQALYRSHFDLYVARRFRKGQSDVADRAAIGEANLVGERLSDAACAYIEAKAELAGEQAKLALVANYEAVHPSRVPHLSLEEQAALDIEQEEPILDQQIQNAVKELVEERTRLAVETTARAALAVRDRIHSDLSYLLSTSQQALCLDRALCHALRGALRGTQGLLQLAAQLQEYYVAEGGNKAQRIKSMNEICAEQECCERHLETSDALTDAFGAVLRSPSTDVLVLLKGYNERQSRLAELRDCCNDTWDRRERHLEDFQKSTSPLRAYIWDGSTKLPNCWDAGAAAMAHALAQQLDQVERQVAEASGIFSSVKNGDKRGVRKLWQYFLTDQGKLAAAMKAARAANFS